MTAFTVHTTENAPKKSREILKKWQEKLNFVPNVIGEIAESPALLRGFNELSEGANSGSFTLEETYVVQLTVCFMNNSSYCLAANTTLAEREDVPRPVIDAIRNDKPLKDPKLEALRTFTKLVMKKMGWVEERDLAAFYKAGYKKEHVMEVILNLSLNFITNYVSHLASTPLDKQFEPNRVEGKKSDKKSRDAA